MKVFSMPRQSINDLKAAPREYLPKTYRSEAHDRTLFLSRAAAKREDKLRCALLAKAIKSSDLSAAEREAAAALLRRLRRGEIENLVPKTLASSRGARKWRRYLVGWLHQLFDDENQRPDGLVSTFTIFPPQGWRFECEELSSVDPRQLMERFRAALNRLGPIPQDGWLFAGLHSEMGFDAKGVPHFDFHLHGLVAGSMIERLEQLRKTPSYGPGLYERVKSAVEVTRVRIRDPQRAISYCFQDWWPKRSYFDKQSMKVRRVERSRIEEPHHTRMLLWMDEYTPKDLVLLAGLGVQNHKLVRTGSAYINDGKSRER